MAMKEYSCEHKELSEAYQTLQNDVVKEIIDITGKKEEQLTIASYFPVLEQLNHVIAQLDVLAR